MKKKEQIKNIPLVNSTLRVVASENLDILQDFENEQEKSISELMNEKKEEQKNIDR
jgi:hypothetical protein